MQQKPIDSPFGHRSTACDVVEKLDLSSRTALVTGASSGLGIETVRALATAGAGVWMPVRNRDKGEAVAEELRQDTGNSMIHVLDLDLGCPKSVRECAASFLALDRPLHMLINNAGIMACPKTLTAEGWESQFATNHLRPFLAHHATFACAAAGGAGSGGQPLLYRSSDRRG